ncbi:MAG: hypothetical protein ACI4XF_02565 [Oscillospiraceae bacterium]
MQIIIDRPRKSALRSNSRRHVKDGIVLVLGKIYIVGIEDKVQRTAVVVSGDIGCSAAVIGLADVENGQSAVI